MIHIHTEWKHILKHAWSVKLALLAGLLGGVEAILPLFTDLFPRGVFALLSVVVSMSVPVARIASQPKVGL